MYIEGAIQTGRFTSFEPATLNLRVAAPTSPLSKGSAGRDGHAPAAGAGGEGSARGPAAEQPVSKEATYRFSPFCSIRTSDVV